jgi:outer membrane protein
LAPSKLLLVLFGCATLSHAQTQFLMQPRTLPNFLSRAKSVPFTRPVDFTNSSRMEMLTRGNRLYLSLNDAIALAFENNLDIEAARYLPAIAATDQLRASAGQFIRSTPTTVTAGPSSASGTLAVAGPLASAANSAAGQVGLASAPAVEASGTRLPNLDPFVFADGTFGHTSLPQANRVLTGVNALNSDLQQWNYGVQKSFLTGGTASFSWNNTRLRQNAPNNDLNPSTLSSAGVEFRQPLLRGFGRKVNSRVIQIAKNNRLGSDLTFRSQVIATVYSVINLYYDLVAFHDQLRVKRAALEISQKLFDDNKREAAIGTLAASDLDRSQGEIAAAEQEVAAGETQVLQQEMLLKNILTRTGIDSLALADLRVIPLDHFDMPAQDILEPVTDVVQRALAVRPELLQSLLQTENRKLGMAGTKDALKPSLDVTLSLRNNALSGALNDAILPGNPARQVDSYFLGNYGNVMRQLAGRNFPDYLVRFSLTVPIGNRTARADLERDQIDLRLQEIANQKLRNAIKLDVLNARLAVTKSREAYQASLRGRELAERNYQTELRKLSLGASTMLEVILSRRDLTIRQLAEVAALNTYARAKNGLSAIVGDLLTEHGISLEEAFSGIITRDPSPLPSPESDRNIP